MITVLLLAHNEREFVKTSVECLRQFSGDVELRVILVDNASNDGLGEWASAQEDISYAYMDNGLEPWGSTLNQVIEAFEIDSDVLIMQSRFYALPSSIQKMQQILNSDESIAVVGPVTTFSRQYQQQPVSVIQNFNDGFEYMNSHADDKTEKVLGVEGGVFLLKGSMLKDKRLSFDNEIGSLSVLIKDLSVQAVLNGYKSVVARSVLFHEQKADLPESEGTLLFYDDDCRILEKKWGTHYFNTTGNSHIFTQISQNENDKFKVLEIGCDCGATLLYIKNIYPNSEIYGCDISEPAVRIAQHITTKAFLCNIESEKIPEDLGDFDYIIFGDVLEHLRDPKKVLEYVRTRLSQGGRVIASIPNLMNISVVRELLKGNFTYTETGLLDKTHIHLFTFNEIIRMFGETGYNVENITSINSMISDSDNVLIDGLLKLEPNAKRFMYETFQYLVVAGKNSTGL